MSKLVVVAMPVVFVLAAVGCGGSDGPSESDGVTRYTDTVPADQVEKTIEAQRGRCNPRPAGGCTVTDNRNGTFVVTTDCAPIVGYAVPRQ